MTSLITVLKKNHNEKKKVISHHIIIDISNTYYHIVYGYYIYMFILVCFPSLI